MAKRENEERILANIPILGYFFRKIKENREAIETTLRTGKETKGEIKKGSFLWLFQVTSGKTFDLLKLKQKERQ